MERDLRTLRRSPAHGQCTGILHPEDPASCRYAEQLGSKLILTRTRLIPFTDLLRFNRTPALILSESSERSRLSPVTVGPTVELFDSDGALIDGNVRFLGVARAITSQDSVAAEYEVHGAFPLGTVSGIFRIGAPQLEEPKVVQMEVETKLAQIWIPVVMLLGIWAGVFGRKKLQERVRLGEARVKGGPAQRTGREDSGSVPLGRAGRAGGGSG